MLNFCSVPEILKAKEDKYTSHPSSCVFKKSMTSEQGKILFLKKHLANMFTVKNPSGFVSLNHFERRRRRRSKRRRRQSKRPERQASSVMIHHELQNTNKNKTVENLLTVESPRNESNTEHLKSQFLLRVI